MMLTTDRSRFAFHISELGCQFSTILHEASNNFKLLESLEVSTLEKKHKLQLAPFIPENMQFSLTIQLFLLCRCLYNFLNSCHLAFAVFC